MTVTLIYSLHLIILKNPPHTHTPCSICVRDGPRGDPFLELVTLLFAIIRLYVHMKQTW